MWHHPPLGSTDTQVRIPSAFIALVIFAGASCGMLYLTVCCLFWHAFVGSEGGEAWKIFGSIAMPLFAAAAKIRLVITNDRKVSDPRFMSLSLHSVPGRSLLGASKKSSLKPSAENQ